MIFVTVGTHEQGMERLLIELDRLIGEKEIKDEIVAQIGYSLYKPKNYKYKEMISYDEMDEMVKKASIVITHGGPGSIFHAIQRGKVPIVVPRNPDFNEHVDDHQILFTKRLERNLKVIGVYDINDLKLNINNYDEISCKYDISNKEENRFVDKFSEIISKKFNL